ncbi:adaptor protein MecA [Camelliibacillus cellulosilyticus]|uniref:Adapter protein MecA n=1 Tax=Camelliibacillus cellulosilyticus TaxID=2174486 RepID=A0ABV9GS73_9BACL
MDIERVNEYTVKFFISYGDIEDRGFEREDIWYNRERGEELFWEMMDEANSVEAFPIEGPLWIQVQALEKGLEIIVTRAQLSKDGTKIELPVADDKQLEIPMSHELPDPIGDASIDEEDDFDFVLRLGDFEDLIDLSRSMKDASFQTSLYHYDDHYYLYVQFDENGTEDEWENDLSRLLEYTEESELTIHFLIDYGKEILPADVFQKVNQYFE